MNPEKQGKVIFCVVIAVVCAAFFVTGCEEALPEGGEAPATPANVRVTDETFGTITIAWDEVSGVSGYRLYRGDTEDGDFPQVGDDIDSAVLSFTDENLSSSTTYWYKVAGFNANGKSEPSVAVGGTTLTPAPVAPENLGMTDRTTTSITLAWDAAADATGYKLYKSEVEAGPYSQVGTDIDGAETSVIVDGLPEGVFYWYKVSSIIVDVESDMSAAVNARTLFISLTVGVARVDMVEDHMFDRFLVTLDPELSIIVTLQSFTGNLDLYLFSNEYFTAWVAGSTTFESTETISLPAGTYDELYIQVASINNFVTVYNLRVDQF